MRLSESNRSTRIQYIAIFVVLSTLLSLSCESKQGRERHNSSESIVQKAAAKEIKSSRSTNKLPADIRSQIDGRTHFARTLEKGLNKKGYSSTVGCFGPNLTGLRLGWSLLDNNTADKFMDDATTKNLKNWGFEKVEFTNDGNWVASYDLSLSKSSAVGSELSKGLAAQSSPTSPTTKVISPSRPSPPRVSIAEKKRRQFASYLNQGMGEEATIRTKGHNSDILYFETAIMTSDYAAMLYRGSRDQLKGYGFRQVHYSDGYGLDRTYDLY